MSECDRYKVTRLTLPHLHIAALALGTRLGPKRHRIHASYSLHVLLSVGIGRSRW